MPGQDPSRSCGCDAAALPAPHAEDAVLGHIGAESSLVGLIPPRFRG